MAAATDEADTGDVGRRYVEEFLNTGEAAAATDLPDVRVITHQLGAARALRGRDVIVTQMLGFREAVPDWQVEVEDGRIVEQWNLVNLAGVGRQLGLLPPTLRGLVAMARHRLFG